MHNEFRDLFELDCLHIRRIEDPERYPKFYCMKCDAHKKVIRKLNRWEYHGTRNSMSTSNTYRKRFQSSGK